MMELGKFNKMLEIWFMVV